MKKIYKKYFLITIFLLMIDIFSKYWILNNLDLYEIKKILSVLNLFHVHNYGVAFSILSNKTLWNRCFLSILSTIIVLLIFQKILKSKKRYKKLAYCFIISGAIGNLIDRIYYGFVIDFIDIHINNWHFATCNISDFSIFIGIIIYIKNKYKLI
ncbi:signal peptidase II [Buchnera aphidicola (Aphis helianthi)]|uniref:Lipoprotein signal peptidase n=1 Tax=Buchnera aphidicola (Aphis helianthi) TaxID=2315802 RepID=A0A4D6XKH1_9GAMM|nr:signal peptidase II [Buchnera aphidicola]QCI16983.1 signal peptidase II [Buchnera aphidicola (Aphis helianthi)]